MIHRVIALSSALLLVCASALLADATPNILSVGGEATVYVQPDNVRVHVGVLTISPQLSQARDENARVSQAVLGAIEALKHPDTYLKSVGFEITTVVEDKSSHDLEPPRIVGYQVRNRIAVRVTNAAPAELSRRAAAILDAAVAHGANELGDIEVFVLDQEPYKQDALLKAVHNAREKAGAIAKALDVKIRGYQGVDAQDVDYFGYRGASNMLMQAAGPMAGSGDATPIEAGLVQITARVSLRCIIE